MGKDLFENSRHKRICAEEAKNGTVDGLQKISNRRNNVTVGFIFCLWV